MGDGDDPEQHDGHEDEPEGPVTPGVGRAVPLQGKVEHRVDLVDEHDELGVFEVTFGHVDVDPAHGANGEGVGAVDGAPELDGEALKADYSEGLDIGGAIRLSTKALGSPDDREIAADQLEVAVLDRNRPRRKFRRIDDDEVAQLLVNA